MYAIRSYYEQFGDAGHLDVGLGGQPLGIHDLRGRGEQQIGAGLAQGLGILLQGARVVRQILGTIELQGIDEDADYSYNFV